MDKEEIPHNALASHPPLPSHLHVWLKETLGIAFQDCFERLLG